ncbi:amidase [SAR202 cluster bacterium AD-804-J14_MRT_500m]|nr:amidase [SAR202 cluster bacterium AD-804-J14_MRT_500m]
MAELFDLTATEIVKFVHDRELSSTDVVESLLTRIEALEPKLHAWVAVDREVALAQARARDADTTSSGLLQGVPIGFKDIYHVAGVHTTACSKVYADYVPDYDATTVVSSRNAGAIILGKSVTTEFAALDPSPTRNPWNISHTPGGSSSGSAAAVAARMCPLAFGSQTVGSVLRPAAYNGVVGLKPTFGRVSRHGVVPLAWSFDTVGWMSRSVEDSALLLQVTAGHDISDHTSSKLPTLEYIRALRDPAPPRIGVLKGYFHEHADQETRDHLASMVRMLERAGASVEEVTSLADFNQSYADQFTILTTEAASFHQPMYERQAMDYQPKIREMIATGFKTDGVTYSKAQERRQIFIVELEKTVELADVILTPSTPSPAPGDITNTGNPMFQGPWTSAGLPVITLPSGISDSGLPLGIHLAASSFAEDRLLSAAAWCESVIGFSSTPPI